MSRITDEIERIHSAGLPHDWLGAASELSIRQLEKLLDTTLPPAFHEFLALTGGGEIAGSTLSGIEDDDARLEYAGTVWGDTLRCREEFGLPAHLIVVYFAHGEVCWCLDASRSTGGEYPVISYSVIHRDIERVIADDFASFLHEFVDLRLSHA